nr:TPA_asm: RNA-dependent RNA polymerase [Toti-like virus dasyheleae]
MYMSADGRFDCEKTGGRSGPSLPNWVLEPICMDGSLTELYVIEKLYLSRTISYDLYDKWMQLNTGAYQLGNSPISFELWNERLSQIANHDPDNIAALIRAGRTVRARDARHMIDEADGDLSSILKMKHRAFNIRRCNGRGYHVKINAASVGKRSDLAYLNVLYPWYLYQDKQMTCLDVTSLAYEMIRHGESQAVNEALSVVTVGMTNTVVTTMLIAAMGNTEWTRLHALIHDDKACCMTMSSYQGYCKSISVAVRRTSKWLDGADLTLEQVSALAYFEMATGRAMHKTDWDEERRKRCGPIVPLIDPCTGADFLPHVRIELRKIVDQLVGGHHDWQTWPEFVMSRQRWVTGGSASGHTIEVEGERLRLNKQAYLETVPTSQVMAWIDERPELVATASEKYEPGKSRAIYGTDSKDQLITSYVIGPLEKRMGCVPGLTNGHLGIHEVADLVSRLINVRQSQVECTMLDYQDFNYQHTLAAQHMVFDEIRKALASVGNPDLDKACAWLATAQLAQYVKFPEEKGRTKTTQGMFSGVRSTDFMNTLLNKAYYEALKVRVGEETGLTPIDEMSLHRGDDVWITNKSRLWAAVMYQFGKQTGFEYADPKQMMDIGRGEFLRVNYSRSGARGYVMRSVVTLIEKPLQSALDASPESKAVGLNSQIHLCYRRGLKLKACEILWHAIIPHALRMRKPDGGGVGIPVGIAMKPKHLGGLDLGPPMTTGIGTGHNPPPPMYVPVLSRIEKVIPSHMSRDWLALVSQAVRKPIASHRLLESIHRANITGVMGTRDRMLSTRKLEKTLAAWLKECKDIGADMNGGRIPFQTEDPKIASVPNIASEILYDVRCLVEAGQKCGLDRSIVDTIISAVAATPYRHMNSAELALGCGPVEAVRAALALCPENTLVQRASLWFESILQLFGPEITSSVLQDAHGAGQEYESVLHPIILSVVSKKAVDCAILSASASGIVTLGDWHLWLEAWTQELVSKLIELGDCASWSLY